MLDVGLAAVTDTVAFKVLCYIVEWLVSYFLLLAIFGVTFLIGYWMRFYKLQTHTCFKFGTIQGVLPYYFISLMCSAKIEGSFLFEIYISEVEKK